MTTVKLVENISLEQNNRKYNPTDILINSDNFDISDYSD